MRVTLSRAKEDPACEFQSIRAVLRQLMRKRLVAADRFHPFGSESLYSCRVARGAMCDAGIVGTARHLIA